MQTKLFHVLSIATFAAILAAGCATNSGPEPLNPYASGESSGPSSGGGGMSSSGSVGSSSSSSGMGGGAM